MCCFTLVQGENLPAHVGSLTLPELNLAVLSFWLGHAGAIISGGKGTAEHKVQYSKATDKLSSYYVKIFYVMAPIGYGTSNGKLLEFIFLFYIFINFTLISTVRRK